MAVKKSTAAAKKPAKAKAPPKVDVTKDYLIELVYACGEDFCQNPLIPEDVKSRRFQNTRSYARHLDENRIEIEDEEKLVDVQTKFTDFLNYLLNRVAEDIKGIPEDEMRENSESVEQFTQFLQDNYGELELLSFMNVVAKEAHVLDVRTVLRDHANSDNFDTKIKTWLAMEKQANDGNIKYVIDEHAKFNIAFMQKHAQTFMKILAVRIFNHVLFDMKKSLTLVDGLVIVSMGDNFTEIAMKKFESHLADLEALRKKKEVKAPTGGDLSEVKFEEVS